MGSQFFFVGFTSTRCQILLQAIIVCSFKENSVKWPKTSKLGRVQAHWAQIRAAKFFLQESGFVSHQTSWSAMIMCNIRKKLMTQSCDRWTDKQTDESDFIEHSLTNVERPIKTIFIQGIAILGAIRTIIHNVFENYQFLFIS